MEDDRMTCCLDLSVLVKFMQAKDVCAESITHLHSFNRRTLDGIAAKVYFYFSLVYERTNSLAQIRG